MEIIEIDELVRGDQQGSKFTLELNDKCDIEFDAEYKPKSKITGKVILMKIVDGINVQLENIKLEMEYKCGKCMTKYTKTINVPKAGRVYSFEKQKDLDDEYDIFYVDMKNMTLDLTEIIRQEIILHFPAISVCSNSCKGLCSTCGKNLNDGKCNCTETDKLEKPLSDLKKLYYAKTSGTKKEDK